MYEICILDGARHVWHRDSRTTSIEMKANQPETIERERVPMKRLRKNEKDWGWEEGEWQKSELHTCTWKMRKMPWKTIKTPDSHFSTAQFALLFVLSVHSIASHSLTLSPSHSIVLPLFYTLHNFQSHFSSLWSAFFFNFHFCSSNWIRLCDFNLFPISNIFLAWNTRQQNCR